MSDQQIQCSDCGNAFVFTEAERVFYDSKGLASPPKRCAPCRRARKAASPDRRPGGGASGGGGNGSAAGRPAWGRNGGSAERGGYAGGGAGASRGGARAPSEGRAWAGKPSFPRSHGDRPSTGPSFAGPPQGASRGRDARFNENRPRTPQAKPSPPATVKAPAAPRPTRPKFDITCGACGTPAQVPFAPLEGRDVFCQACYRARRGLAVPEAGVTSDLPAPGLVATEPSAGAFATDELAAKSESSAD